MRYTLETVMTPADVAAISGVAEKTLASWRSEGCGPAYHKFGRSIRYHREDVELWMEGERHGAQREKRQMGYRFTVRGQPRAGRHRLGGHRTKSEKCRAEGSGTSSGHTGGTLGAERRLCSDGTREAR
jgi:hypothetical protein